MLTEMKNSIDQQSLRWIGNWWIHWPPQTEYIFLYLAKYPKLNDKLFHRNKNGLGWIDWFVYHLIMSIFFHIYHHAVPSFMNHDSWNSFIQRAFLFMSLIDGVLNVRPPHSLTQYSIKIIIAEHQRFKKVWSWHIHNLKI